MSLVPGVDDIAVHGPLAPSLIPTGSATGAAGQTAYRPPPHQTAAANLATEAPALSQQVTCNHLA